jgi:hypothetical protein
MARKSTADQQAQGDVVLERLAGVTVPASLKAFVAGFRKAHASLASASGAADAARTARDASLHAVGAADATLDAAVDVLADKLVGAQLGNRQKPFKAFSKYRPSDVTSMPYATEVKEVLSLVAAIKKAKPHADVAKASAACQKLAGGVTTALSGLSKPQLAYSKSLAARDALLPGWTKALDQLKKNAAAVWFDDTATYKAVFAPPEKVQAPVKARKKKAAAVAPVTPTPAAPAKPPPS